MHFPPKAELEPLMFKKSDFKRQKIFFVMLYFLAIANLRLCLDQIFGLVPNW